MVMGFLQKRKKMLEGNIPEYQEQLFKKMANQIRKGLLKKENELNWLIKQQKTLILGEWATEEKKTQLYSIKNTLLQAGLYAKTIDDYYDIKKRTGLSQLDILQDCCIKHQLIVFIDGVGAGLQVEQEYLRENYPLHIKILFFIEKNKFRTFKDKPNEYLADFSSIVPYNKRELNSTVLAFARMRIHRLTRIIKKQKEQKKGMHGDHYSPWRKKLNRLRGKN